MHCIWYDVLFADVWYKILDSNLWSPLMALAISVQLHSSFSLFFSTMLGDIKAIIFFHFSCLKCIMWNLTLLEIT